MTDQTIFTLPVVVGILTSAVRLATPYLFAAVGEAIAQSSGVLNLGVDGIMLLGAFAAFYVTLSTGSLWLGVLAAMVMGLLMGLLMSVISVTLKAPQGISGIGLYMFGLGLSSLLFKVTGRHSQERDRFPAGQDPDSGRHPRPWRDPVSPQPAGLRRFSRGPPGLVVSRKTTWGLKIKAVGHNPAAADSLGVNVDRVRYASVCLGAVLAGLAGASLSLALVNLFQENLTAGMGFIAVALVYFGGWRPVAIMGGALLFSSMNALQLWMQVLSVKIPSDLAVMLPYVLTIVALAAAPNLARQPTALNKPFERGEH